MSGPESNTGLPDNFGGAAGGQAQFNLLLQLVRRLVTVFEGQALQAPYQVYPWTDAGPLDIAAALPRAASGILSIRQGTPAAINVTLPSANGPWTVGDGAGVAGADNITVLPPVGFTINGGASDVISTNWEFKTYVIDGANFIISSHS